MTETNALGAVHVDLAQAVARRARGAWRLTQVKAERLAAAQWWRPHRRQAMSSETVLLIVFVVAMFATFAVTMLWAERQTNGSRKG
jgi:hypothetical protein